MQTHTKLKISAPFLSVIVPVYNEGEYLLNFIPRVLAQIGPENQVIVVDGGSNDGSVYQLKAKFQSNNNLNVISAPKSRALQMNVGAKMSTAENLLFLHADTILPEGAMSELRLYSDSKFLWGRFDVQLNNTSLPYRIISWFINGRSRLTSIATGDQAIFIRRELFEKLNGYAEQPLMEDVELTGRLKKISKPYCIRTHVITSARKWEKEGVCKTVWLMWKLRASYAMGARPEELIKQYYKH
jgi:rSAM/selenodomain-associated transferase 2